MRKTYYQLVRFYNKRLGYTYIIHEARKDAENNIEIASIPLTLEGNHPDVIRSTILKITQDIKKHPVVDKDDCNIYHDNLWYED